MSLRDEFIAMDDRLARFGVPRLTAWWREGLGDWLDQYEAGRVLELLACAGRGSAKSTALYKLALFFTLFGDFTVPAGERHYAVVLSRLKEEAGKGLDIIGRWLDLLGVAHRPAGDVIEVGESRGIRVVAASVAGASGWRAFFVAKDERSKWATSGIEERDAEEIDTSASAMTATHENAPTVSAGSAWVVGSAFHDAVTAGSDERRTVLGPAPTWIAAPHVSESSTRRKERDPRRWAREYACEFQASVAGAFDADEVDRAFRAPPKGYVECPKVLLLDPTAGSSDTYAWCAIGWRLPRDGQEGHPQLVVEEATGIDRATSRGWTSGGMVKCVVAFARKHRVVAIHSDQFERFALASAFGERGFAFHPHNWTAASKESAVARVRQWLRDGTLVLPTLKRLRTELLQFEERFAPSGALTFRGRTGGHDDFAMLILLAAFVDIERGLPGSPLFEVERQRRASHLRMLTESMERQDWSDEQWALWELRQQERGWARISAATQQAQSQAAVLEERLEWNTLRFHQGSTPLKPEEIAELIEHGRIPDPNKPKGK